MSQGSTAPADWISAPVVAQRLGTTPPTVRKLIENGDLVGTAEQHGQRLRWLADPKDVERYLDDHGPFRGTARDTAARTAQRILDEREGDLLRTFSAILEDINARLARLEAAGSQSTGQQVRDNQTTGTQTTADLLARLELQRAASTLQHEADAARSNVVTHLIAGLAASEIADGKRREVITALNTIVGILATEGHVDSRLLDENP